MKKIAIVSYNMYCNFTNYGSALQTYALFNVINSFKKVNTVVLDYCPDVLLDKNPLNPIKNTWDSDEKSIKNLQMLMKQIEENNSKFNDFYKKHYNLSTHAYTSKNFDVCQRKEDIHGYVCGSDTIFCTLEFDGFDDGYFANYPAMQGKSVAYAASFGDATFDKESSVILNERLQNFKMIGLREDKMIQYCSQHTTVPVKRVLDPTLLLKADDYRKLYNNYKDIKPHEKNYLLYYSRRYNPAMERYVKKIAEDNKLSIIEISIRAENSKDHSIRYDAGVEEFLELVDHASYVVTNSFHGAIFSIIFRKPFTVFTREQANSKINELLSLFGLENRLISNEKALLPMVVNYDNVEVILNEWIDRSKEFLYKEIDLLEHINVG